jgi:hypothetical protein
MAWPVSFFQQLCWVPAWFQVPDAMAEFVIFWKPILEVPTLTHRRRLQTLLSGSLESPSMALDIQKQYLYTVYQTYAVEPDRWAWAPFTVIPLDRT